MFDHSFKRMCLVSINKSVAVCTEEESQDT